MDDDQDIARRVGARVRELRDAQGLTLEHLAEIAGMPPESIGRIERGQRAAALGTLVRLGRALGVPPGKLLDPVGAPAPVNLDPVEPRVRGIAARLAGASDAALDHIARVVDVLVEWDRTRGGAG